MAAGRPLKEGLDYSNWVVDIFDNDPKIDKLLDSQGAAGFLIYFYLCQRAYGSEGYFFKWSYDDAATTSRKIGGGVRSETVKQAVGLCLQIGLFHKRLFDRDRILTSRGIQKRYWRIVKDRTPRPVIKDYWLLSEEESPGVIFCTQNPEHDSENPNYNPRKSNYQPPKFNYESPNKSKENKTKKNKIINTTTPTAARAGAEEQKITPSWLFSQYFGREPVPAEKQRCDMWLESWDAELVEHAFFRACDMGQGNLAYVSGILQDYRSQGITDMGGVAEDDMRHDARGKRR